MKNIFKYAILLLALLPAASCDDYLDVNTDPNNPTVVSPDLILPVAMNYSAIVMDGRTYREDKEPVSDRGVKILGNMLMYNWSQSDGYAWYPDEFKYNVTSTFYNFIFEFSYSSVLKQYQVLEGLDEKYDYYKAISKIMKAYHFQILVDMYGNVPYSEALQRSDNPTPIYDDAQSIYNDLIVQLTDAIRLIKTASEAELTEQVGDDDAVFAGDMTKWIAFANTLKVRILTRQSDLADRKTYIQAQLDSILAEGTGTIDFDVEINPGYISLEANKQNPFWEYYGEDPSGSQTMNNKATCATDYILDYLTTTNDPRINRLYEEPATGHVGVPQGLLDYDTPVKDAYVTELVSNIGAGILKSADQGSLIFSYAEHMFNLAELALKGFISADPQEFYEAGIRASFDYLDAGDASTYYSQALNNVGYTISTNKLAAIITQKWIASNGTTAEQAWFDYSRTGFPVGLPKSLLATSDRPVRLFYPASEISANGENVPSQPDAFTAKIFWAN